jgi:hypothetical protein
MRHETTHHLSRKALSCSADMITNENVKFLDLIILSWLRRKCMPLKLLFKQKDSSLIERQYLERIHTIHNVLVQRNAHTHIYIYIFFSSSNSDGHGRSFLKLDVNRNL